MLATIILKHFPSKCPTNTEFIAMMRLVHSESGAEAAQVCEHVAAAVKSASQVVGAEDETWLKLLELVKPEQLTVAKPGIFGRLWNTLFGSPEAPVPASPVAVPASPVPASPVAASPAPVPASPVPASPVAAPASPEANDAAPVAAPASPEATDAAADLKQGGSWGAACPPPEQKAPSVPEEKLVVPEPEKAETLSAAQSKVQAEEPSVVPDKCEAQMAASNPDASPKAAGAQKKKKNHGHK
jgi:hypothetical protein